VELIADADMPKDLQTDILKYFKELPAKGGSASGGKAKFVAVRSSATAEDSKNRSWAGELRLI